VPLGILMAKAWGDVGEPGLTRAPDWLTAGFATLLGVGLIVAACSQLTMFSSAHSRLAGKVHPDVFAMLKPSVLYTGLILMVLAVVGRNIAARTRGKWLSVVTLALLALATPALLARWAGPIKAYADVNSSRRLASTILSSPEKDLPVYGYYYFRPSLPFYLRRPVGLVTTDANELTSNYLALRVAKIRRGLSPEAFPNALSRTLQDLDPIPVDQRRLLDISQFLGLVRSSPQPRLVLVSNTHVSLLASDVGRVEPLWMGWGFSVWKIPGENEKAELRNQKPEF